MLIPRLILPMHTQVWDRQTGSLLADLSGGHTGRIFSVDVDYAKVRHQASHEPAPQTHQRRDLLRSYPAARIRSVRPMIVTVMCIRTNHNAC